MEDAKAWIKHQAEMDDFKDKAIYFVIGLKGDLNKIWVEINKKEKSIQINREITSRNDVPKKRKECELAFLAAMKEAAMFL